MMSMDGEGRSAPFRVMAPLPVEMQVEVTGSCNLSCRMCLVAYRPRLGRSASMSIDTFMGLLDDLPTVRRVTLQGLGEPLLAPDLEAMIAEAVRRGIEVGFNTNGTLLTRDRSERLVAAGLHWLHVSIDGARPETFAAIRQGGRLATVVANLRQLIAVRLAADRHTPHVQLNTVVMRRNVEELQDIVRLAADIGVDRLWVQGLSHDFDDVDDDAQFVAIRRWVSSQRLATEHVEPHFEAAVALAAELGLDLRLPGPRRHSPAGSGRAGL